MATGKVTSILKGTTGDKATPLHHAAQDGNELVVKPLLDLDMDVNAISENEERATALCKHCCAFASTIPSLVVSGQCPWHTEHQPNWSALVDSALTCASCAMMRAVLQPYVDAGARYPEHDQPIDLTLMNKYDVDVRIRGHKNPANLLYLYPPNGMDKNSCIRIDHEFLKSLVPRRPINYSMGLESSIQLTKYWLQSCHNHHTSCRLISSGTSQALPTRVLDVGSNDGTAEPFLFNSDGQQSPYVALSHCWGGRTFACTTKSSVKEMQTSIPMANMSRTLQDAVLMTRGLGFQYLWVDYICIVQDDAADWERESSQMGAIYNHASLTIAAIAARDGTQGCLMPRDIPSLNPVRMPIPDWEAELVMMPTLAAYESQLDTVELRPLETRAWTLQESILSRRTIGFERGEMVWECNETRQSESHHGNDMSRSGHTSGHPSSKEIFGSSSIGSDSHSFHAKWCSLVQMYSKRNLTLSKDKLPAISGVARLFSNPSGAGYLAGKWTSHLLESLLWTCVTARVSRDYRAPTWSWASVDGPIRMNWQFTALEQRIQVLDAVAEPLGDDPFGQLWGAHLTLLGKVKDARCSCQHYP